MKFGLSFLPDASPPIMSADEYYKTILNLCILAELGGLHSIKMTEHYLHPYGGYCPDPLVFLATVAGSTQRIRLMTGCVLPAFHHPIQLASRIALVDVLSQGRLDVGLARAYLPYEFEALEIDMEQSRLRYFETIQACKKLWVEEALSLKTDFFKFQNVSILPKPYQKPFPPLWGAAVMSRQSFASLGEWGLNLLVTPPPGPIENLGERIAIYKDCYQSNQSCKDHAPEIAISLPLLLDENEKNAVKQSDEYLARYLQVWGDAVSAWRGRESQAYSGYARIPDILAQLTPKQMREHQQAIVGTPEMAIQQIQYLQDRLPVTQILWQVDFGAQPETVARRTVELFIHEVMPYV